MIKPFDDEYFMREALKEAQIAFEEDEVPIGAVITLGDQIIARGHNMTEKLNDVTAHAEIQAITAASESLGSKYLKKCTLYVTVEPCVMCSGALYWSQIDRVVFATADEKRGASTVGNLYHPKTKIENGLLADEAANLIQTFFKNKR